MAYLQYFRVFWQFEVLLFLCFPSLSHVRQIKKKYLENLFAIFSVETKKHAWHFLNFSYCLFFLPGHLSSSSIYPVCLAPYLIVTTCSDSRVRFWRCAVEGDEGYSEDDRDNRSYRWEPWALMNEEEDNNSAVCVSGRPVAVSCSYIGRLAMAFKKPRQAQVGN